MAEQGIQEVSREPGGSKEPHYSAQKALSQLSQSQGLAPEHAGPRATGRGCHWWLEAGELHDTQEARQRS